MAPGNELVENLKYFITPDQIWVFEKKMALKKIFLTSNLLICFIACIFLFALFNLNHAPVKAQTTTQLVVTPASNIITLEESALIDLKVLDGVNINAFDLTITYNPAIISLDSWQLGDYLSNLAQVKKVEESGILRLVYTQLATAPVSGDGILLQLVFRGLAAGNSSVALESVSFADSVGNLIYPQLTNGMVTVQSAATTPFTPTLTATPPTLTATSPIFTATATSITPEITKASPTFEPTPTSSTGPNELVTVTATEANPQSTETPPGATTMIDTSTVIVTDGNSEAGSSQPYDQPIEQAGTNETDDQSDLLNKYLWGTLILSAIILVAMIIIAIKRKNTEHLKEW